ncbi:response regulator transcription factor [Pontibacter sp. BT310]|uniref:LytTR family DNA-binding domain-containing protein n=1 Tax=Pontibacter populi TaxID=890055 RepID=A0ABS6XG57_9BACT|nr:MULTISPECIES: LytTR family DNA-binding domain-containing protein [Pontibacter]MBJ6120123.1 response regulator transcription factor [Pontibacter sp. BT310]MBR0572556.1 response regulator transcription factor [Microvirga sp. STS03]MBW3366976.1 LytTR family DNA-binding domain-containing protein [Pontibacter populi]
MKTIRCLVVDDKPLALDILTDYIKKVDFLEFVASTTSALEALKLVEKERIDLLFLDIQMPELTGIQVMKILGEKCRVILTTAYTEYALEGYEHNVVDYLLKPIAFDRFYKAVQKAKQVFDLQQTIVAPTVVSSPKEEKPAEIPVARDIIFVKTEYKIVKLRLDDILYVEGLQNYVSIYTKTERILSLKNIKKMEELLPSGQFVRVHKSYIISLDKIDSIERNRIFIGEAVIPVGETYKDNFMHLIAQANSLS